MLELMEIDNSFLLFWMINIKTTFTNIVRKFVEELNEQVIQIFRNKLDTFWINLKQLPVTELKCQLPPMNWNHWFYR